MILSITTITLTFILLLIIRTLFILILYNTFDTKILLNNSERRILVRLWFLPKTNYRHVLDIISITPLRTKLIMNIYNNK